MTHEPSMSSSGNSKDNGPRAVTNRMKKTRKAPMPSARRPASRSAIEGLGELRKQGEQIADQSVVGDGEDRGLRVGVDGDDDLAFLHASKVLDRARDAAGDVEVRSDDL